MGYTAVENLDSTFRGTASLDQNLSLFPSFLITIIIIGLIYRFDVEQTGMVHYENNTKFYWFEYVFNSSKCVVKMKCQFSFEILSEDL